MGSLKIILGGAVLAVIFIAASTFFLSRPADVQERFLDGERSDRRSLEGCEPIHWHPKLKIMINGADQPVPSDIGIITGQIIDTDISGMRMSPTHTHSDDGIIHMENNCPQKKPESYTLGYFFQVWEKRFDRNCILDHCADATHRLRMLVNGKENNDFAAYRMQDGDEIEIIYEAING